MKKYILLVVCLMALSAGATDMKYKGLMEKMETQTILNGIVFEAGETMSGGFMDDFEKTSPGLGWARHYYSGHPDRCTVSFYIYDQNPIEFQFNENTGKVNINSDKKGRAKIDWENIPVETWRAYNDIAVVRRGLQPEPPEMDKAFEDALRVHVKKLEKQKKLRMTANAPVSVLTGQTADKTMGVGVTAHRGTFLKVRMTCDKTVSEQKMQKAIADGAKWLRGQISKPAKQR